MSPAPSPADKKNIVKMAYIYFQEGRWDKAIEEYKKLLQLDPEDVNTHNMLGDVFVKKGAHKDAFDSYLKVSTDFSTRGQTEKAVVINRKIAALDTAQLSPAAQKKQHLLRQALKAETAMEQGNMDEAIEALNEVAKADSENLGAYAKLGELLEKKGKIPEAVQQYTALAGVFLKNRLYKKALELYQKVVQLEPANVEAHHSLAQIYVKQGSESDAKKEFLVAAEHAQAAGDLDKSEAFAAKAVEFKSIEAHYILGIALLKKQKLSEAKAQFENLLRFKVNHVGALAHLGKVLLEMNQADKAGEPLQKALKAEKDNPVALEAWVEYCLKKGNKAEAAVNLKVLVERYASKDELEKACAYARDWASLEDSSPAAHEKLGDLLQKAGKKEEAVEAFYKAATLQEKAGKKDAESALLRKVLELDPGHAQAQQKVMGQVAAGGAPPPAPPKAAPAPEKPEPKTEAPPKPAAAPETVGKIGGGGVLDLDEPEKKPEPVKAAAPEKEEAPAPAASGSEDETEAQILIADDYVSQGLLQEAIEIYQQVLEARPGHAGAKKKLNAAYTAYVKSGEEVLGALEEEKKAKEEEEKRLRHEMEAKAREEAEKKLQAEMAKAKEETERKAREEAANKLKEEAEKAAREQAAKQAKEDAEARLREEGYRKAKEEAEAKIREELKKKMEAEARSKTEEAPKPAATPAGARSGAAEDRDEFMTTAVADIYTRQGLHEEAAKIYRKILQAEPGNVEARKKLEELESTQKVKAVPKPAPEKASAPPPPAPPPPDPGKDSGGKKRSNRVGYV